MDTSIPELVSNYLRSLKLRGFTSIPIDSEATRILRSWYRGASGLRPISPQQSPQPVSHQAVSPSPSPEEVKKFSFVQKVATEDTQENLTIPPLHGSSIEEQLDELRAIALNWQPALKLATLRNQMVFSVGNPHAQLMLVGEAPGYHEERRQEPFVGPAGEKLNAILLAMGLHRQDVYISNIVKFRPALPNQTTNNRAPSIQEIEASLPIISKEIELVKPKAIVALGATAAKGLLHSGDLPLSALRGSFREFQGIPVRVTYHPSYLLRSGEISERRKVWEDMLAVMELLEMPISEKQRGYFLPKHR
jgi:DNA polymerase